MNMKPSERISKNAIKIAQEDLGSEYGYMGKENAGHYVLAILNYFDEQYEAEEIARKELKDKLLPMD